MRHVRSILYAVVLAAAVWVLCGAGLGHGGTGTGVRNYSGLLLVLLAGIAYAILIFAPISPAGPLLGGVIFLGASVWALASPSSYADLWPAGVTWADLSRPGHGIAALLAVPMIATAFSVRRWETYEPAELPVFGRLGRTPGVARPAGTPAAGLETAVLRVSDPDSTVMVIDMDQTQLVRAPEPPAPDPALLVPELVSESVPGPVTESADPTIVISQRPGDQTMVIPNPEAVAAADATQVIPRDLGGDRQVIKPPAKTPEPAEADKTQVIKPPAKTPEPAEADKTQVIKPPANAPEPAGAERKPVARPESPEPRDERPPSIAGAERPDPAEDPTTRLQEAAKPAAASDNHKADAGGPESDAAERPRSATNLERPADEAADDTRPLRTPPIPGQRRRRDDDEAG